MFYEINKNVNLRSVDQQESSACGCILAVIRLKVLKYSQVFDKGTLEKRASFN